MNIILKDKVIISFFGILFAILVITSCETPMYLKLGFKSHSEITRPESVQKLIKALVTKIRRSARELPMH